MQPTTADLRDGWPRCWRSRAAHRGSGRSGAPAVAPSCYRPRAVPRRLTCRDQSFESVSLLRRGCAGFSAADWWSGANERGRMVRSSREPAVVVP